MVPIKIESEKLPHIAVAIMSGKLCVQANNFQGNLISAFVRLRDDKDFTDVTLVCEDGHQLQAHKLLLATSSQVFEKMFQKRIHGHPLVYFRGVKSENLAAILDFIYFGEANIDQETLDSFFTIAGELKLKGLNGKTFTDITVQEEEKPSNPKPTVQSKALPVKAATYRDCGRKDPVPNYDGEETNSDQISGVLQALDEKVKSLMGRSQNLVSAGTSNGKPQLAKAFICKVCGKEGRATLIRDHIEANHLEGISILCNYCNNVSSSRNSLGHYKAKFHK